MLRRRFPPSSLHRLHMQSDFNTISGGGGKGGAANKAPVVLQCDNLSKSHAEVAQFKDVSLAVTRGQCVALIGPNGTGKSTLLKCLAGVDTSDGGTVRIGNGYKLIYVEQDVSLDGFGYDLLFRFFPPLLRYYQVLHHPDQFSTDQADEISQEVFLTEAGEILQTSEDFLEHLQLSSEKILQSLQTLSGGEKKKLALAAALLQEPDILLLDEPTNHLDAQCLHWLAKYLRERAQRKGLATVLVTHDRHFMENTCDRILELEKGTIVCYDGGYSDYLTRKAELVNAMEREQERMQTKMRTESEWMSKQPRARQAKSKARQEAYHELSKSLDDMGERLQTIPRIVLDSKTARLGGKIIDIRAASYSFLEAPDRRRTLFEDFTYSLQPKDRIGVVGPNGVGKSTFLKLIAGQQNLTAGHVTVGDTVRLGYYSQSGLVLTKEEEGMSIFNYIMQAVEKAADQDIPNRPSGNRIQLVIEETEIGNRRKRLAGKTSAIQAAVVESVGSGNSGAFNENEIRKWLTHLQFPASKWYNKVGQLSGGERRRLQLLHLLASQPNVLLLDEATNDLDIQAITALEDYIVNSFPGVVVVVSHDIAFLNAVTDHLFLMPHSLHRQTDGDNMPEEDNADDEYKIVDFLGSYDQYLELYATKRDGKKGKANNGGVTTKGEESSSKKKSTSSPPKIADSPILSSASSSGPPLNYNERKELPKLEKEVARLGVQINEVEQELADFYAGKKRTSNSRETEITERLNKLRAELATKEARWMTLAARA
eukprot:gene174-183_t